MFSGLWIKISGFLGVALAFMVGLLKYKNQKIDNLEADTKAKDRIIEVTNEMQDAKEKLASEAADEKSKIDDSDWVNRI